MKGNYVQANRKEYLNIMISDLLIVVDMQNDFITGTLGNKAAQNIVNNVVETLQAYKNENKPVVFTKDVHSKNYLETFEGKHLPVEHCIKTEGGLICDELLPYMYPYDDTDRNFCIHKYTFGYIGWPQVISHIEDVIHTHIDSIEICGLCTDICVVANAIILRACYPGMKITVDSSCCAGTSADNHEAALKVMKSQQIDVIE